MSSRFTHLVAGVSICSLRLDNTTRRVYCILCVCSVDILLASPRVASTSWPFVNNAVMNCVSEILPSILCGYYHKTRFLCTQSTSDTKMGGVFLFFLTLKQFSNLKPTGCPECNSDTNHTVCADPPPAKGSVPQTAPLFRGQPHVPGCDSCFWPIVSQGCPLLGFSHLLESLTN